MDINIKELKKKKENGEEFILIDVREDYEHEDFNLGGRLIPLEDFMAAISDYAENKAEEVVIYCRTGIRSAAAQDLMQSFGFTNVRNLIGGVVAWQVAFGR